MKRNPYRFHYHFQFPDNSTKEYLIALDPNSLSLLRDDMDREPAPWTRLVFEQCKCCPLTPDIHPWCPIALNIMELVHSFKDLFSYHDCSVTCEAAERSYTKRTSVMEGLSAIFGVIMATSDCPVMEFLKPMARFHLPLASSDETLYRIVSMYALSGFLRMRRGQRIDSSFDELFHRFQSMRVVNRAMAERLKVADEEGSTVNGIILLDYTAQLLPVSLNEEIDQLERLFHGYLEHPGPRSH